MIEAARTTPIDRIIDIENRIDMKILSRLPIEPGARPTAQPGPGCLPTVRPNEHSLRQRVSLRANILDAYPAPLSFYRDRRACDPTGRGRLRTRNRRRNQARSLHTAYFFAGPRIDASVAAWADEIADLVRTHCGDDMILAIDRSDACIFNALSERNVALTDAQEPLEAARLIKSPEEILCMNYALATAEIGFARMHEQLRPGMTENEFWSILWQTKMAMGGEWIEGRLLTSGERTNPWFQESSDRVIRPGDLVAFDTDMIGPFGYCADISRTFRAGPGKPTAEQRDLYKTSYEQLYHNIDLLKPGMSFRELAERAWPQPEIYAGNRYVVMAHGVGLCDEYPAIYYLQDWEKEGYDGTIEPHMVLCIESYIGAAGGRQGVKLEEQVLITENGYEILSRFPFEDALLA